MNFYTGIATIKLFDAIFDLLKPFLSRQKATKICKQKSSTKQYTRPRKLQPKDEFLLTLMRFD